MPTPLRCGGGRAGGARTAVVEALPSGVAEGRSIGLCGRCGGALTDESGVAAALRPRGVPTKGGTAGGPRGAAAGVAASAC